MIGQFLPIFASITIDVDISAVFMALLFIALFVSLNFILIGPYLKARDERTEATRGAREDAVEDTALAEAKIAEYEERLTQIRIEASEIRETLRNQGSEEAEEIIEEVRSEVMAKIAVEREKIEKEKLVALEKIKAKAQVLAELIVSKIVPSRASL